MKMEIKIDDDNSDLYARKIWRKPELATLSLKLTANGALMYEGEDVIFFLSPCLPGTMNIFCS